MARSLLIPWLILDIHHCIHCSDSLGIKMLGADPVNAAAQAAEQAWIATSARAWKLTICGVLRKSIVDTVLNCVSDSQIGWHNLAVSTALAKHQFLDT